MKILPTAYLPSISYISHIIGSPQECTIDLGEHYIKRSIRNRTRIATAQGVMELTVPVRRANKPRQPITDVEIDNSKRWQHQHWNTIVAAYKSSPYFDHYAPYIEPLYIRQYNYLVEFNTAVMEALMGLLYMGDRRSCPSIATSPQYIEATATDLDLRQKNSVGADFEPTPDIQVFSDRLPFEGDLSILDLIFCEGPSALRFL